MAQTPRPFSELNNSFAEANNAFEFPLNNEMAFPWNNSSKKKMGTRGTRLGCLLERQTKVSSSPNMESCFGIDIMSIFIHCIYGVME